MTTHRRDGEIDRAATIFQAAVDLPACERTSCLDSACGSDVDLRREADRLLAAHDQGLESFLEQPPIADLSEPLPDRIGPYRILALLGEGGMGVVYLAEQDAPIRRRVALKVIKPGMDSKAVIARFDAERQALAMMDHAGVARVYDAGATEQGRPYFAMEYVGGAAITEYCDVHQLDIESRLRLFLDICEAVQHAHQKGIIHRDLKPGNILVADQDGAPVLKVIDFGVAKATAQPLTEATVFTVQGQLVGTPAYMSPEQAGGDQEDLDTRSDIYSLGVVLYELLTGALPFSPKTMQRIALDEIRRMIRTDVPPKPSTRYSGLDDGALDSKAVAQNRGTNADRLTRRLRGDLDWITMKALEKERARRYGSASDFAADVRRHLDREPVVAGPPSRVYYLRKLVARNPLVSVAVGVLLLSWTLATVGGFALYVRAERARVEATTAATTADAVVEFLVTDMVEAALPAVAQGREITVNEVLETASNRLSTELADAPREAAWMRMAIGRVYLALGDGQAARQYLQAAYSELGVLYGADHRRTLSTGRWLADAMSELGATGEAERLARQTVDGQRRLHGWEHRNTLDSARVLAIILRQRDKIAEAQRLLVEISETLRSLYGSDDVDLLVVSVEYGALLWLMGENVEAQALYQGLIPRLDKRYGAGHPMTIGAVGNYGLVLWNLGQLAESEDAFREVLAHKNRIYGEDHPNTINTLANLAVVLALQGRYEEALPAAIRCWESSRRHHGELHRNSRNFLWNVYQVHRYLDDAEGMREWAPIVLDVFGRAAALPDASVHHFNRAALAMMDIEPIELRDIERGLSLAREAVRRTDSGDPYTRMTLALALERAGEFGEAVDVAKRAYEVLPRSVMSKARADLEAQLARLLERLGRLDEVEPYGRREVDRFRKGPSAMLSSPAPTMLVLSRVFVVQERVDEARAMLRDAREVAASISGDEKQRPYDRRKAREHLEEIDAAIVKVANVEAAP